MSFTTLSQSEVRDNILRDIKALNTAADISKDSDYFIRANSVGSAVEGLYQHQTWVSKQIFPDSADEEFLLMHAALRQMNRKAAVVASGVNAVTITGVVGASVPSGLALKYSDNTAYTTTSGGDIGADGTLVVGVTADVAGTSGNRSAGDSLTLTVPPTNVNATATVVSISGGTDIETLDALLARLLVRIRRSGAGGNKYDYYDWAMQVDGVSAAYIYPMRRGLGTVDIVITSSGGLPSADTVAACQAWIDDQRPVTAKNALVLAPTIKSYDVTGQVKLSGVTLATAQASILSDLSTYDLSIAPGQTAIKSRIEGIVTDVSGVTDRVVTLPSANVLPTVDATVIEWCRLGNVNFTAMP